MNVKFSIIIPIYNAAEFVRDTIQSIYDQTFKSFEIICVDDGSTDNSLDVLNTIKLNNPMMQIISQNNAGAGVARNKGISVAKGDFIVFLDSDDKLSDPNVLANINALIREYDCDIYMFGFNKYFDEKHIQEYKIANFSNRNDIKVFCNGEKEILFFCEEYKKNVNLFIHNWIAPWNKVYRRDYLNLINAQFDSISSAEDRTFHFQTVSKAKKAMLVDYPIVNYRMNVGNSLTANFNEKKLLNHIAAYDSIIKHNNFSTKEERKCIFKSTVSDIMTFYLRTKDLDKQAVFHRMYDFFMSLKDDYKDCQNIYEISTVFFNIVTNSYIPISSVETVVPIVFATNETYAPYLGVAIESLINNCDRNSYYQVYVFYTKLSKTKIVRLENMSIKNVKIQTINVTAYLTEEAKFLYGQAYYSIEMYYRMIIPKVLPMFDKVLYLDCDIVVLDDVKKLYNLVDFHNNELIAAVRDWNIDIETEGYLKKLGIKIINKYINSGVLLMNVKRLRAEQTFNELSAFLKKYTSLRFPDQDLINSLCYNRICYLENYWNYQWSITFGKYYTGLLDKKIGIIHFTTKVKPWNNPLMPLSEKFWDYAKKTSFYEEILYRIGQ